jgi:hypothetical protein
MLYTTPILGVNQELYYLITDSAEKINMHYQVKTEFMDIAPYLGNEFRRKVESCCNWLSSELNIPLKGRIPEYIKNIQLYERFRGCFCDEMYYCLQSFSEINQVVKLKEHLSDIREKEFLETINKSISGAAFKDKISKEGKDDARNFLFELSIASEIKELGIDIDLSSRADIVFNDENVLIECKRVRSKNKLITRIKEAIEQSAEDVGDNGKLFIFVDVTEIFDDSKAITVVNETDHPLGIAFLMSEAELRGVFESKMEDICRPFIKSHVGKIQSLCVGNISGVVINYHAVGFHISAFKEEMVFGSVKYLVSNKNLPDKNCLGGYFDGFKKFEI